VKGQALVFRSFAELRRKALPVGFVRRCGRRGAEHAADKPVPRGLAPALAGEPYADYVVRWKGSEVARRVKVADLEDNARLSRVLPRPQRL
jgi:hypothetical protein